MQSVDILHLQAHFSWLLQKVTQGETIIVTRDGTPRARLTPIEAVEPTPPGSRPSKRQLGLGSTVYVLPDDFFTRVSEPHDAEILEVFEASYRQPR